MSRNHTHSAQQAIEARLALRLAGGLSARSETLPHDLSERLRVAREQALVRAREVRRTAPATAAAPALDASIVVRGGAAALGGFGGFGGLAPWWQRAASVLPLVVLVAGLVAIDQWAAHEQVLAAAEIDSQLLSDTLPPAAYSDPGFAEYLRTAPNP